MRHLFLFCGLALLCLIPVLGVLSDRSPARLDPLQTVQVQAPGPRLY